MTTAVPQWPGEWQAEIPSIRKDNGALGPSNSLFKKALTIHPPLAGLADTFVTCLLDPHDTPRDAKTLLIGMNDALVDPAKIANVPPATAQNGGFRLPSAFPLPSYTAALEYIAAKALWEHGHTEFLPWPFDDIALKPDFAVRGKCPANPGVDAAEFYDLCTEVADTLKVGGTKTTTDLVNSLYAGVTGKLAAYPTKQVAVFLDACDNPCLYNGAALNFNRAALCSSLTAKIVQDLNPELKPRLVSVFVLFPDWHLEQLHAADWH
ncbi:hypothetical protein AB0D08_03830 [Kitasatospora sp. NPDC048540]|uniref:hypothetical protein n=1 Tax=unclassified Kitasatospora TaxID=2633591 RepID=UPI00053A1500|nr:hypothetical protein [Kitasatospora sp. MBT63]